MEEPELVEEPEAELDVEWVWLDDGVARMLEDVAAGDDWEAANAAVPPVSAMAAPAIPAVILRTRRRASCRRVTASLGLGRAW